MPRLVSFDGIEIRMNTRDHLPVHVHVFHRDCEAIVLVDNGDVYAGEIAGHALAAARVWVAENREQLHVLWNSYRG